MSFTAEVRDELSRLEQTRECCNKAELSALLRLDGTVTRTGSDQYRLEVSTENAQVARRIIRMVKNLYGIKPELTMRRNVLHKTNNYQITIPNQPRLEAILLELGLAGTVYLSGNIEPALIKRECCSMAYLRGAFLSAGFIASPKGDFHFEIRTHTQALAQELAALMARFNIEGRVISRRDTWTVYLKGAEPIINFLALVGAHNALLETENVRIIKSYRNDVNRRVNAEIANQAKASEAALSQLEDIRVIDSAVGLDSLAPALADFARLRMQNPDLSLRELGEASTPPLSKSAVNHRMRRLHDKAQRIKFEQSTTS
ncbi:MAG: DNA-binding protein WhiA [Coriobacteriia bacterium]|nr:DNA-binding protein WhiA [Coriobacteriia bacterium]MCL2537348.1 DNA-binding protein WhiA [Coriobacteriia bacterium]